MLKEKSETTGPILTKKQACDKARLKIKHEVHMGMMRMLKHHCPCTDCKVPHPWWQNQWDHVRGKHKYVKTGNSPSSQRGAGVSFGNMSRLSWDIIYAEFLKLDIVCANCHSTRTHERKL